MNLPRRQKELYDRLLGRGDVFIVDLYEFMRDPDGEESMQFMQRWLSPYIVALNRSLSDQGENLKVEPGALKNTYRLIAVT